MTNLQTKFLLTFLGLITIIAYSSPALAMSDRCPRQNVKTELKIKRYKPKLLRGSLKGINDYLNSHSVLAFASDPLGVKAEYKFSLKDIGQGRACVMLEKVRAHYFSAPRIVMPKDFKKNSCEYKIILEHEKRHQAVFIDYFDRSSKQYAAYLGRIAKQVPVSVPVTSEEEAEEMQMHIRDYFTSKFAERVMKSRNEMIALQDKIDSPQEYTFTNKKINMCAKREEDAKQPNKKTFYDPNE